MLAIALLVFREVLEAALIVSIVAAATRGVPRRGAALLGGMGLGVLGALLIALGAGRIAGLFSGVGQEIFNATVLLAAVLMIAWHVVWMASHGRELAARMQGVGQAVRAGAIPLTVLVVVVALAVLREGSEVVLFLYGMLAGGAGHLGAGLALGLAAGMTVGLLLYSGLLRIPLRHFFGATNTLLILLAAGLAAGAAAMLVQADLLPALGEPLWDSSALLGEHSLPGQALHVLVGYSARPTPVQLLAWLATVLLLASGMRFAGRMAHGSHAPPPRRAAAG
jgi:high-affinity iron transporter